MSEATSVPGRADFRDAGRRCLDFLASQYDAGGRHRDRPGDPSLHYKAVYGFHYGGRRDLALRALDHVANAFLDADGGYRDRSRMGPASWFLYEAGWLAWGSAALGRFDLARRIARRMMAEQDTRWGGFWNEYDLGRVQYGLTSSAAMAGCAAAGEVAAAESCARMMERLIDGQPDPDRGFYWNLTETGQVAPALGDNPTLNFYAYQGPARPALFATPIAALVWTGRQTGRTAYFDLARRYADVMLRHREPHRMTFASKSGWAALELAAHRPDPDLLAYAAAVGGRMLELQTRDGAIDSSGFPGLEREVPVEIVIGNAWDWALTAIALGNGGS